MTRCHDIVAARLACRHAYAGDRREELADALKRSDPDRLYAYARRHRIAGLLWFAISDLGAIRASPFARLARDAARIRDDNKRAVALIDELEQKLGAAQIDRLHLKGVALASLVWPDPMIKSSWDIDLLVDVKRLADSAALLEQAGFRLQLPRAKSQFADWHRRRKESVWWRERDGAVVELHGRALVWPGLGPGLASPRQSVALPGGPTVETFADDELRQYLALHGASSLWFRLKWIADYAALVHRRAPLPADGKATRLADALARLMFDDEDHGQVRGADRWLLKLALRETIGTAAWREPTGSLFGTLPIHLSQLVIGGIGDLPRQLREAMDD